MVEPIFGVLGAVAVTFASTILPYALSFAAGAMIYIVADDILPEAHTRYVVFMGVNCLCNIKCGHFLQWERYAGHLGHNHWFRCYDVPGRWPWLILQPR